MKLNIQLFAHTNQTANYDLPQFVGTDKPTWLGDFNEAMSDIDAGMHKNATSIATMQTDVNNATQAASKASQDVNTLSGTVTTLSGTVTSVQTTANNASQTASSALNTANTANGKADTNAGNIATNTASIASINAEITETNSYSYDEKVIGTWVDGKPLYRKIINFGALPNNALKQVAHNITKLGRVVLLSGFAESSQNLGGITLPHATSQPIALYCDSTTVDVLTTNNKSDYNQAFIVIEYTKSTD